MPYGINKAYVNQIVAEASNVPSANQSSFSSDDLLKFFPQFGASSIKSISINAGGSGYSVDDVLTILQTGGSLGTAQVTSISSLGAVIQAVLRSRGEGYSSYNSLSTTVLPAGGTGCKVNIVASALNIDPELLQMFIDMAYSSLAESRWKSKWKYAMSLYVAHFLTLWLKTQAGSNATAAQVVATAQTLFSAQSKSVGDVSVSYDTSLINGSLPGWGMWMTTTYGTQLAQLAAFLPSARAGMYVY